MPIRDLAVRRFTLVSTKSFEQVLQALMARIGQPDMERFREALAGSRTPDELRALVRSAVGDSDFMEFARFDAGELLRRENARAPRLLRLLVGNPLVMMEMARHVPDAASYAPVTLLIDEREDGVHLSYDEMASFISGYGNPAASGVAEALDARIELLLRAAAS